MDFLIQDLDRMAHAPTKRDILDELLTSCTTIPSEELEELKKITHLGKKYHEAGCHPATGKNTKKKTKTTHYLSPDVSENLDAVRDRLKQILPRNKRTTVSKSAIVNCALEIILKDFSANGKGSKLLEAFSTSSKKTKIEKHPRATL